MYTTIVQSYKVQQVLCSHKITILYPALSLRQLYRDLCLLHTGRHSECAITYIELVKAHCPYTGSVKQCVDCSLLQNTLWIIALSSGASKTPAVADAVLR